VHRLASVHSCEVNLYGWTIVRSCEETVTRGRLKNQLIFLAGWSPPWCRIRRVTLPVSSFSKVI